MGKLLVQDKDIVAPGDVLATGMDYLPANGTFRAGDEIIASQMGLVNLSGRLIKLIPLSGKYLPKEGDNVIGVIEDVSFNNWFVNIGAPFKAALSSKEIIPFSDRNADLTQYYNFGDVIYAAVAKVTRSKIIDLTMRGHGFRKIVGGRFIEVSSSKVPRIIGKQGSMISMVKEATECKITVGQNGKIWIKGENTADEEIAIETILKIEKQSHLDGLTEEINSFLESKYKGKKIGGVKPAEAEEL